MSRALFALLLASIPLAACGGKVLIEGSGGGSSATSSTSSTGTGCLITLDPNAPQYQCAVTPGDCSLGGQLPDGTPVTEECTLVDSTHATCSLYVNQQEQEVCPASRIDWASTCANGVPTCAGWCVDYVKIENGCPK